MAFRAEINNNLFYKLPEHLQDKIMKKNRHRLAELLIEYKDNWCYDYREKYDEFPDEKHYELGYLDDDDYLEIENTKLWGTKFLEFYERMRLDDAETIKDDSDSDSDDD